jgi:uncharacterized protein (DUF433 family)
MINWRDFIHSDPNILVGKPVIKGTRIAAELILERLGYGWSFEQIIESYPHISIDAIRACILFAVESIKKKSSHKLAA